MISQHSAGVQYTGRVVTKMTFMASEINIYSFFSDIQKFILDFRKRICDIQNTITLISDIEKRITDIRNNYFGYPK